MKHKVTELILVTSPKSNRDTDNIRKLEDRLIPKYGNKGFSEVGHNASRQDKMVSLVWMTTVRNLDVGEFKEWVKECDWERPGETTILINGPERSSSRSLVSVSELPQIMAGGTNSPLLQTLAD